MNVSDIELYCTAHKPKGEKLFALQNSWSLSEMLRYFGRNASMHSHIVNTGILLDQFSFFSFLFFFFEVNVFQATGTHTTHLSRWNMVEES